MKESHANPSIIGMKVYPKDNSYSFTLGSSKSPRLAGWFDIGMKKVKQRKVTIVSEPYDLTVTFYGLDKKPSTDTYQFVTVEYRKKLHVVLNTFSKKIYGVPDYKLTNSTNLKHV